MANEPADRLGPADLDGLVGRLQSRCLWGFSASDSAGKGLPIYNHVNPDGPEAATAIRSLQARCAEVVVESADLKLSVVTFCAPYAIRYAGDYGLPSGHLHSTHYDLLEKCGARMDDFTRDTLTGGSNEQ